MLFDERHILIAYQSQTLILFLVAFSELTTRIKRIHHPKKIVNSYPFHLQFQLQ